MSISFCPRCGGYSYERLRTHAFCFDCNYNPDLDDDSDELPVPGWVFELDPSLKPHTDDARFQPKAA